MRRKYDFSILPKYKYPNLVAEFMESGYSLCTLSDYMGNGRCEEDNLIMREKIFENREITTQEAMGLARLFGCKLEYLFSHKLEMFGDVPTAYIRHYDSNKQMEQEMEIYKIADEVRNALKSKPYLKEFMKLALTWSGEQVKHATKLLQELKTA